MTVVDQRSRVPRLDRAARERLRRCLNSEGVAAAYLIGSQARGKGGPLSDIDLAVLHSPELDGRDAQRLRLDLARAAGAALGTGEVDVVLVNDASPLLRHRVARDGRLLVDRDPRARIRFQAEALRDFLDTKPLRAELRAACASDWRRAALVDAESIEARLSRLGELLEQLEGIHAGGETGYVADFRTRLATQRALQLAIQNCIDVDSILRGLQPPQLSAAGQMRR